MFKVKIHWSTSLCGARENERFVQRRGSESLLHFHKTHCIVLHGIALHCSALERGEGGVMCLIINCNRVHCIALYCIAVYRRKMRRRRHNGPHYKLQPPQPLKCTNYTPVCNAPLPPSTMKPILLEYCCNIGLYCSTMQCKILQCSVLGRTLPGGVVH